MGQSEPADAERAGDVWTHRHRWPARYGVMVLSMLGALLLRAAITPLLGQRIPFLTFFPAVTVASWFGGLWPGIVCTLLSALIAALSLIEPSWRLTLQNPGDIVAVAIFVATGIGVSALNEALRRERGAAMRARSEAERTAETACRAQRAALAANRAKDEFLSIVSHELRTPLTSILGWAEMMRTREMDAAGRARALDTIVRNAKGQAQIIDDLLDISRIVAGKLRLSREPTILAEVVRSAIDVIAPAAEAKGITLTIALDPDVGTTLGDPGRLRQIAWNLLSNAVKFNRSGGHVDVWLGLRDDQIELRVADTGPGIAPEFLPHVFERFTQEDVGATRTHRGLGLGLAIAKNLVELHGGTILAESAGPGAGATFIVTLPRVRANEAADPASARPARTQVSLHGVRVLVVDDDPDTLDLIASILKDRGATITAALSAREALRLFEEAPIDVLVSDIGMPEEDGYALIEKLCARRAIRALALTAFSAREDERRALTAGFRLHMTKPVVPDQLVDAVAALAAWETPEAPTS